MKIFPSIQAGLETSDSIKTQTWFSTAFQDRRNTIEAICSNKHKLLDLPSRKIFDIVIPRTGAMRYIIFHWASASFSQLDFFSVRSRSKIHHLNKKFSQHLNTDAGN